MAAAVAVSLLESGIDASSFAASDAVAAAASAISTSGVAVAASTAAPAAAASSCSGCEEEVAAATAATAAAVSAPCGGACGPEDALAFWCSRKHAEHIPRVASEPVRWWETGG